MNENGRERGRKLVELILETRAANEIQRRPNGLRPSELGRECARWLWLRLRWADDMEPISGRLYRLFETGQLQEARIVKELRSVGSEVFDVDPDNPREQISINTFDGHSKGYLDSVLGDVPFSKGGWCVGEYKTHSEKSFKLLDKDGVAIAKPEHYAQMQIYMHEHRLEEALYYAVNKNDDQPYAEFIDYDKRYIERLYAKGERVVHGIDIPERLSNQPTFFTCKWCSANEVCFNKKLPGRNCRTCAFSHPLNAKERERANEQRQNIWLCEMHGKLLDLDDQRSGCPDHRFHPHMVTGDSAQMGEEVAENETVNYVYRFEDGRPDFVDSGQPV